MEPILARLPSEDRDRVNNALRRAMDGESDYDEVFALPLKDGGTRYLHGLGRRIMSSEGAKFIGVTYDITSERETLAQREILLREMNHRVKNLFAIIAAMVSISRREATDLDSFAEDLRDRIHALGRSHSLTSRQTDGPSVTLRELLDTVLAPSHNQQEMGFEGPDVEVPTSKLTSLALILHEWATNAAKHGGLRDQDGAVHVRWERDGENLRIDWEESSAVSENGAGAGFGTRLLEVTARQLSGTISGEVVDTGYRRSLTFPIAASGEGGAQGGKQVLAADRLVEPFFLLEFAAQFLVVQIGADEDDIGAVAAQLAGQRPDRVLVHIDVEDGSTRHFVADHGECLVERSRGAHHVIACRFQSHLEIEGNQCLVIDDQDLAAWRHE